MFSFLNEGTNNILESASPMQIKLCTKTHFELKVVTIQRIYPAIMCAGQNMSSVIDLRTTKRKPHVRKATTLDQSCDCGEEHKIIDDIVNYFTTTELR